MASPIHLLLKSTAAIESKTTLVACFHTRIVVRVVPRAFLPAHLPCQDPVNRGIRRDEMETSMRNCVEPLADQES